MPGCSRDLAVSDHWSASLQRSRARRNRAAGGQPKSGTYAESPSIVALLGGRESALRDRDLAEEEPWQLSLGRSRARRRAIELQFVPGSSRAKRMSLGALAALTVGPAASLAGGSAAASAASGTEAATTTEFSITLSAGEEGRQVEMLQSALGIAVDGIYGPQTEAAVESFQAAHGLSTDGIAGPQTMAALHGGAGGRSFAASTASVSSEAGSEGDPVKQLQAALQLPADGVFGPETEAAVRRLQARHGLTVDGIVGPATWTVIGVSGEETLTPPASAMPAHHSHRAHAASAATSSESVVSGSAVERLQHVLKLPVDGTFGPETEAAVRRLQARHGLTVDGVVGPATWAALGVNDEESLTPPASARASAGSSSGEGSSSSEGVIAQVISAGDEIATRPYVWGGGHGSFISDGYDCSGSVSYALHGGGLLSSPEDSSALESYGEAGPGRFITIYANSEHAFMVIDGKRFDTVALAETGTRWSSSMTSTAGFVVRHPDGL
jgi:peptidoglycan hydrolase-like protein with peptidoglycan-binding domain